VDELEIERIFIIDNANEIIRQLSNLGFNLVNGYFQVNTYLDHPNNSLVRNNTYLRIRHNYHDDEFVHGEVSLGSRKVDKSKNDVRSQVSKDIETEELLTFIKDIMMGIGLKETFVLEKKRTEFSKSSKSSFRNDLHVELDSDVRVMRPPNGTVHHLKDTLQLCIETNNTNHDKKSVNKNINELMNDLKLSETNMTRLNYLERGAILMNQGIIKE